jgi:amidase
MTDQARREVLIAAGAMAVSGAIFAGTRGASAQNAASAAASEWDYRSITQLSEALQARKISARELADHTIARIEALDQRLNAVVVRDFERARETAKAADAAIARGERRPLLGIPMTIKEALNTPGVSRSSRTLCRKKTRSLFPG